MVAKWPKALGLACFTLYGMLFSSKPIAPLRLAGDFFAPLKDLLFGFEEEGYVFYPVVHRNYFFWTVSLVLVLLTFAALFLWQLWKARRRLQGKNLEIEAANAKMTSSIQYASRIQQGLLPLASEVQAMLPGSFVYYQPKDIVSGDFYWVSQIGQRYLVAVIDCTGHGVPGAFLTIMVYQLLQKIIVEHNMEEPSEILSTLTKEFAIATNQKGETEYADGVEMGLCLICPTDMRLYFSSANIALVCARQGQLNVVKHKRVSIGGAHPSHETDNPFQQTAIDMQPGDRYYMSTDGYPDQFGGAKGKKFLFKELLASLVQLQDQPIEKQGALLASRLQKWKGDYAQTDDVLVMGFEV